MRRTSTNTLIFLLAVIATFTRLTSTNQEELCTLEPPLSIFGVEIGEARSDLESHWTLGAEQNPFFNGYSTYHRYEPRKERDVVIYILFNENDRVVSIVGEQLERADEVLASIYMTTYEACRNIKLTTLRHGARRTKFSGGYLGILPLTRNETSTPESIITEVCIGSEPRLGTRHEKNVSDHNCDSRPYCGPHVLQR